MRKRTLVSFVFGLLLAGIGLLVNYINFNSHKRLLFAFNTSVGQAGFGWSTSTTSAVIEGETYNGVELLFSFPKFMLYALALGAVFFIIFSIFRLFKDNF